MTDYIERDYIGKAYMDLCRALSQKAKICPGASEPTVKDLFAIVAHAPAADVAPVVHGRWIERRIPNDTGTLVFVCSACGGKPEWMKRKYCPNCGARMDGGTDDAAD